MTSQVRAEFNGISTNNDLRDVSFALRNLFTTGSLSASEILYQTGNMVPKFRAQLHAGAKQISSKGWTLSKSLEALFPPETMPAIRAGEESGKLSSVFDQIWRTAKIQEEINRVLNGLVLPFALIGIGILVSLAFFIFLVPSQYRLLASGVPESYNPGASIRTALYINDVVMSNLELTIFAVLVVIISVCLLVMRTEFRDWVSDLVVRGLISIKPLGEAYANLKFGIMAQYLQIVSLAGLDADKRIDLVIDVLPLSLRQGIVMFRSEMLNRGIGAAANPEGRHEDDPRHSTIQWPLYIRLAFRQSEEGTWDEPMREFGEVMLEDGKDRLKRLIETLKVISIVVVALLLIIPVGLLYGTLGEILTMRMRMM
ncbi:type II secretion system F family protein [Stutzerimonas stutzeri]|uniref:type II secretion system F family protein n=1 Tax=Stutzerimonas stutzeri TaxID=316 RepID=UPI00265D2E68|nr:type II secretion system F family protein [Stutzerimonas stutzeri]MCF6783441.1 type II secretion system F family protein [Stutzerimonas stutzeri]